MTWKYSWESNFQPVAERDNLGAQERSRCINYVYGNGNGNAVRLRRAVVCWPYECLTVELNTRGGHFDTFVGVFDFGCTCALGLARPSVLMLS